LDHLAARQRSFWQNRIDQLLLGQPLARGGGLQILVGHIEVAVPQVIADRQLMLAHLGQVCFFRNWIAKL
jgi:hypothetical protein